MSTLTEDLKSKIESAFNYCYDKIEESGDYSQDHSDSDQEIEEIKQRAREAVLEDLTGYELVDLDLKVADYLKQRGLIESYLNELN